MNMENVLVTGAGGFIGSHLVEKLVTEGRRVTALVHYNSRNDNGLLKFLPASVLREAEVLFGDVQDEYMLQKICMGKDVVFHLAALIGIPYSYIAPESYINVNVQGTLNILKSALRCNVGRVVHTSTSEVYGSAKYTPMDEEHPLQGQSPYSASKIAADKIAESFHRSFGLPVVTVRPFNTYGPRQSQRAVVPTIITQALDKGVVSLGATASVRDFNYVSNTVDGFFLCGNVPGIVGKVFNIGYGHSYSIADLVGKLSLMLGKKIEIKLDKDRLRPESSEVTKLECNFDKARRFLGYTPCVTLEDGLKETIHFIQNNPDAYGNTGIYVR
jgi:NAD dependent epimerase/dehydratase